MTSQYLPIILLATFRSSETQKRAIPTMLRGSTPAEKLNACFASVYDHCTNECEARVKLPMPQVFRGRTECANPAAAHMKLVGDWFTECKRLNGDTSCSRLSTKEIRAFAEIGRLSRLGKSSRRTVLSFYKQGNSESREAMRRFYTGHKCSDACVVKNYKKCQKSLRCPKAKRSSVAAQCSAAASSQKVKFVDLVSCILPIANNEQFVLTPRQTVFNQFFYNPN